MISKFTKVFLEPAEVAEIVGVSKPTAYRIIKSLNTELQQKGYVVQIGKVNIDISTTTLPKDRLHKKGGMYEKKVADGYDVLEVEKGLWVEAIFAKVKPEAIKPKMKFDEHSEDDEEDEDADVEIIDDYNKPDEDDVELEDPNDEDINENNYRTTFAIEDVDDEDAESLSDYIADE